MISEDRETFNELDIKVNSQGLWKENDDQREFDFKIGLRNESPFPITKIQFLITSIPTNVDLHSEKGYHYPILRPNEAKDVSFNFEVFEYHNGRSLESIVIFNDPSNVMHTISIKSYKIQ